MNLKIISKGSESIVSLLDLSKNLDINSEIYSIHEDGEFYLGVISHKTLVFLATEFADYALKNYAKREIPEAEVCLSLTRKWIEGESSVSKEELRAAAAAAYAYAADAAANAADAAADAADSAYAAGKDREREFIRQGEFILGYLKNNQWLFHL